MVVKVNRVLTCIASKGASTTTQRRGQNIRTISMRVRLGSPQGHAQVNASVA